MIPGVSKLAGKLSSNPDGDKILNVQESIVLSMTLKERNNPNLLNASRKKRIANGSGRSVQQVNILLKQFKKISITLKKASKIDQKSLASGGLEKFFS